MGFISSVIGSLSNRLRAVHVLKFIMLVALLLRLLQREIANWVLNGIFPSANTAIPNTRLVIADSCVFNGNVVSGMASGYWNMSGHTPGAAAATFIPALIHRVAFELTVTSEISWQDFWQDPIGDFRFSAIIFRDSFGIPYQLARLIYLIARRVGADEEEGLLAAFLLAASNTWNYHIFSTFSAPTIFLCFARSV